MAHIKWRCDDTIEFGVTVAETTVTDMLYLLFVF